MGDRKRLHVTQRPDGTWQVRGEGAGRASAVCDAKSDAVSRGREIARNEGNSQLLIHGANGRIQTEHTYDKDPCPPKG
jgi:hypothetical protein